MILEGHERVTVEQHPTWRWWVWIDEPLDKHFPKRHGRLTATPGRFRFGRGGVCRTEEECLEARMDAKITARAELAEFVHRPTHMLMANGSLKPIGSEDEQRELGPGLMELTA